MAGETVTLSLEQFFETWHRSEIVKDMIKECKGLHEKMLILCLAIDTIVYTEGITHEEVYKKLDDMKPVISEVNMELGKEGILP